MGEVVESSDERDDWKIWEFDEALGVRGAPDVSGDFGVDKNQAKEEHLETVLLRNLDEAFPDWHLRPLSTVGARWGTADLEAVDPAGTHHVFELKYGSSVGTVLSQVLSYPLDQIGANFEWFDAPRRDVAAEIMALRTAAVWSGKEARSASGSIVASSADASGLEEVVERYTEETPEAFDLDAVRDDAKGWFDELRPDYSRAALWPDEPHDLHFHLVVPNPSGFVEDSVLHRFVDSSKDGANLRIDVWQVGLELDREETTGRLAVRNCGVKGAPERGIEPLDSRRVSELLSEMAWRRPDLHASTSAWNVHPGEEIVAKHSIDNEPSEAVTFRIRPGKDGETFEVSLNYTVPDAFTKTDCSSAYPTVYDWTDEVPDEIASMADVSRSNSNQTGYVRMPTEEIDFEEAAEIANDLYEHFLDLLVGRYGGELANS